MKPTEEDVKNAVVEYAHGNYHLVRHSKVGKVFNQHFKFFCYGTDCERCKTFVGAALDNGRIIFYNSEEGVCGKLWTMT